MGKAEEQALAKKLVVVGDGFCGKTCLLLAFATGHFEDTYTPTIFETDLVQMEVDGRAIELGLWDTAGQEDYDRLRPLSYTDTDVILLIYSIDNPDSLANIREKWLPEVRHFCPRVPFLLVATKSDLRAAPGNMNLCVSTESGQAMADEIGARGFFETSSRKMDNIAPVFEAAARVTLKKKDLNRHGDRSFKCCLL